MELDLRLVFSVAVVIIVALLIIFIIKKAFVLVVFVALLALLVPPFYTVAFGDGTEIVASISEFFPEDIAEDINEKYAYYREKDIGNNILGADAADDVVSGFAQYGAENFESAFATEED